MGLSAACRWALMAAAFERKRARRGDDPQILREALASVEEQTAKKAANGKPLAMETELIILAAVLMTAGFLSGIVAGLLGVGGGMILVPVLFQTFIFFDLAAHLQIHMAVASSMAIICFTGSLSARAALQRGAVDMEVVKKLGRVYRYGRFGRCGGGVLLRRPD